MAIIGIGIDIIKISRINKILSLTGTKLAKRVLSDKEWNNFLKKKNKINFLAKKIAAKEAAAKALGTGMRNGITFNNFEIYNDIYGKPILKCIKKAKKLVKVMNINNIYLSLTDEKKYVCALVIFEK